METKIIRVNPRDINLLELNARFMKQDEFKKLVSNIKRDGCLTQLPFCCRDTDGEWVVLSGNHRVQASIEAGLKEIDIQVTEDELTQNERVAIQLSHNSISGQDDMAVLKQLYESIDDISFKEYSGLDDETLKIIDNISAQSMSGTGLQYQVLSFAFLPNEVENIKKVLENVKSEIGKNEALVLRFSEYDKFLDTLTDVGKSMLVKNTALSFLGMLEVISKHMDELKEEWIGQARDKDYVPISSIVGRSDIKSKEGRLLNKVVDKMLSEGKINKKEKDKVFVELAKHYLGVTE